MDGPERIRTLHILTSLNRRGAETFAVQMIDRLSRDRFSPAIWTTKPAHSQDALVPERTPLLSDGAVVPSPLIQARSFLDLIRVLKTVQPHLVQCHGGRALKYALAASPFWRPAATVYNKILSIHPHLDHPARRVLYGYLFERVDAIVAVGEQVRRELKDEFRLRRPRLVTISNGRDVGPFARVAPEDVLEVRRALGLQPEDVCLMAVGSLAWEKDPHFALRLLAEILPAHPTLRLVFVGEGPLEEALGKQAVTLAVDERVRFLGVRHDVPRLLFAADIVILPSITEGLPGVLIEAGMAGRPAVAYGVGAVADVLVDGVTGFVVTPGDAATFQQRVRQLIRDSHLRQTMGQEALTRCRRDFDIEASVRKYEALFSELVATAQ